MRSFLCFYLSPFGNVRAAGNPHRFVASTVLITSWLAILRWPLLPTSPSEEESAQGDNSPSDVEEAANKSTAYIFNPGHRQGHFI